MFFRLFKFYNVIIYSKYLEDDDSKPGVGGGVRSNSTNSEDVRGGGGKSPSGNTKESENKIRGRGRGNKKLSTTYDTKICGEGRGKTNEYSEEEKDVVRGGGRTDKYSEEEVSDKKDVESEVQAEDSKSQSRWRMRKN